MGGFYNQGCKQILNTVIFLAIISFANYKAFAFFDSDEVNIVQGGVLDTCPKKTVEEMVDGFMADLSWETVVADDGKKYVNISGVITYDEKPVMTLL